jgi:saccharopine dehydrogenase (NAD+, L-lysine-forming)
MQKIKLGIIKEGKVPPDHRVALTPKQCKALQIIYPNVEVVVQSSPIRAFKDDAYEMEGINVVSDLSDCDIIMGIKEVKIQDLIPNKKFIFFSHTIKKQPYNRDLLRAVLDMKIQLIDYELMRDKHNKRIIGFGRYAGIVGAYNAFLTLGLKTGDFSIKPAHECINRKELERELAKVVLPKDYRIVLTGFGRVGHGAREIVDLLPIKEVTPEEFLSLEFDEPVFTQLEAEDYYGRKDGSSFNKSEFYSNPELYESTFGRYLDKMDMYIPCHYWSSKSPLILTQDALKKSNRRLKVVADISCDIDGPIATTIRSSKIEDPIYGYNIETGQEDDFRKNDVIAVMAVDNLPCELPLDASEDFGNDLLKLVFTALFKEDPDQIIYRASETNHEGKLNPEFNYLQDYVDGKE